MNANPSTTIVPPEQGFRRALVAIPGDELCAQAADDDLEDDAPGEVFDPAEVVEDPGAAYVVTLKDYRNPPWLTPFLREQGYNAAEIRLAARRNHIPAEREASITERAIREVDAEDAAAGNANAGGGEAAGGESQDAPERPRPRILTVDDLDELPEPVWMVDGLVPADNRLVGLSGFAGVGKTFAALDLGLSVAAGVPWLGRMVRQGHVVYLPLEGMYEMRPRINAWLAKHGLPREAVRDRFTIADIPTSLYLDEGENVVWLHEQLTLTPGGLFIIDTLPRALAKANENDSVDLRPVLNLLREMVKATETTIMLIEHTGWNTKRERGSTSVRGELDAQLHLEESKERGGKWLTLRNPKQRSGLSQPAMTCRVVSVPGHKGGVFEFEEPGARLTEDVLVTNIVEIVRQRGSISQNDLADVLREREVEFRTSALAEAVEHAVKREYIDRQGKGRASRLVPGKRPAGGEQP